MATQNDATLTNLGTRVSTLEKRADTTEATITMHYSKYPLVFKVASIAASLIATLGSILIAFYVFKYVPKEISDELSPIKTDMAVVKTQVGELRDGNDLKLLEDRLNLRMERIEKTVESLTNRLNDYIDRKLLSSPAKFKESYRRAFTSPHKVEESITVAEDLWMRSKKKGLSLSRSDIQDLAQITLPVLRRNLNEHIRWKAWNLAEGLASDSTKVKKRPKGNIFPCKDGQTSLGGGIQVKDMTVANCKVTVNGNLILKNVRFIHSEFEVVQSSEGREFLAKLLLSKDLKVTMGE